MNNLDNLLKKYFKLSSNDKFVKEKLINILKDNFRIDINTDQIKIKDTEIFINSGSIIKTEIFLNKGKIIYLLNESLGDSKIKNIF
jgi:hypothetical protein